MRFRDVAVSIVLLGMASGGAAQEVDFRLQAGPYIPLSTIAEDVVSEGWIYSLEQTRALHVGAALVLWWTPLFGTSLTGNVVNPDFRQWGYYDPQDPSHPSGRASFEQREGYMQTQLSGRAVLRVLRLRNFAADASLGVAYTHFGSGASFRAGQRYMGPDPRPRPHPENQRRPQWHHRRQPHEI